MKKNKKYKFKGWDYTEIAECLGIEILYDEVDDENVKTIRSVINQAMNDMMMDKKKMPESSSIVIKACRDYLRIMKEEPAAAHYRPLWDGLYNIKDDFVFLQMTAYLLPHMWT